MISNFEVILGSINSLILLFFFHCLILLIQNKLKTTLSKNFLNIFLIFVLISLISLLLQIILIFDYQFFFIQKNKIKIFILVIIYLNLVINFQKIYLYLKGNFLKNFNNKNWVNFFLLLVFISSLGIVNDADSLTYHSKFSKIILSGFQLNYFYDNPHYLLIGTFEVFNILPELIGISNFNTLLNFYVLLFLIKFIYEKFNNKNFNSEIFLLLIISAPVITIILTPQKSFFVPLIIQFLCFCYILYNEKLLKFDLFLVLLALILTCTFKLNFIITAIPIFICLLIKKNDYRSIKLILNLSTIIFLFILVPHLYFKTFYFESPFPPFLNNFINEYPNENLYSSFLNELKEWKRNSIFFPANLIINYYDGSFASIHNSLGVGILGFLFIKKINSKNFKIIFFLVISIIFLNILFVQKTPRFYFLPYLISLLIILEAKIHNLNFLKRILNLQFIFTIVVIGFLSSVSVLTTFVDNKNNDYKKKFIFRYAAFDKINKITGGNNYIIVDLPNYFSQNFEISTMILRYISNENELQLYKNYLNKKNISYFFSINQPLEKKIFKNRDGKIIENFFLKCFKIEVENFSLPAANRKRVIFNTNNKISYYVYRKNKECKF